jgi:hypothetical protein
MDEKFGLRDHSFGDLFHGDEDMMLCDFMDWDPWDNRTRTHRTPASAPASDDDLGHRLGTRAVRHDGA